MNLSQYLEHIGIETIPTATLENLAKLQHAHRLSIPFENLDVRLGRGISVDDAEIFDKLITQKRGGYCFEHNALLRWAMREVGFNVRPLLARVWLFADKTPPKTHTLNLVTVESDVSQEEWIADAGFGSSYCPPMPLREGAKVSGPDGHEHRLIIDADHGWMKQIKLAGKSEFKNEFSFTLEKVADLDLVMSNHWTSTAPQSRFLHSVIVNKSLPNGMIILNDNILKTIYGDKEGVQILRNEAELKGALQQHFGIAMDIDDISALHVFEKK